MRLIDSGTTKAQSFVLLAEHQKCPSVQLRNRLFQMNIGLARREAHRLLHTSNESFDDLVQVGSLGLLKAIERFDVKKGYAFSTFATPFIRGEIKHYLRDQSATLRIPRRWQTLMSHSAKAIQRLQQNLNRSPSEQEIADELDISVEEWQQIKIARSNRSLLSLDRPTTGQKSDAASLGDLLPDSRYQSFQLWQDDRTQLQEALSQLEQRTRDIIELVYFKDLTCTETARRLNLNQGTVSRRLKRGLTQLKMAMQAA